MGLTIRKGCFAIFLLACYSCLPKGDPDIILEDFEGGTFSDKWEIQGTSFKNPVRIDSLQEDITNVHGKYFAYSMHKDSGTFQGVGKLISKPFTVDRKFLSFLIAGHQHETRACVNLIVDNNIVRTASGNNDFILRDVVWNVVEFQGKEAYLEIVDALAPDSENGYFQRVMVDHFVLSDKKVDRKSVFEDFESGTFNNWQVIGEAFSEPKSRTSVYYPISANGFKGNYFAFSFGEEHDVKQGKLISSPFTIQHDHIQFLIGGGSHEGATCMNLLIEGEVVRSAQGEDDGNLRLKEWEVSDFKGKLATIEIVDQHSGDWGHVMVDQIIFYNNPWWEKYAKGAGIVLVVILGGLLLLLIKRRKKTQKEITDAERFLLERVKSNIIQDKAFINPKYSVKKCADALDLEADKVEQLFQDGEGKSFVDYINELRVEEFKKELNDPKNNAYTMIHIAKQCGFSSKTAFYRIFKSVTNITPTDYKKQL
ncbi:hypothetical protein GCM10028791_42900 [Echinicola sediminis]